MGSTRRERFFGGFVRLGTHRPGFLLILCALAVVASLALASRLEIQTSRFGLVAPDNPYQSRLLSFFERFGQPDMPVFVVAGGEPDQRRAVVDLFVRELETSELYEGRTMARVGPEQVAEVMFLAQPEVLTELRASLPEGTDIAAHVERGLPGMVDLLRVQIDAGVAGEVEVDAKRADEGLERIAALADLLDRGLAGEAADDSLSAAFADRLGERSKAGEGGELPQLGALDERGYLVGRDGTHHLVAVFPELAGTEVADFRRVVADLRERRDRALASAQAQGITGVEILATGLPVLTVDEEDVLRDGMLLSSVATSVGIFLSLWIAFRSLRRAVAVLMPMALGTVLSLGALALSYGHLNTITSGYLSVLMGLGIDFSVHVHARIDESLRGGSSRLEALRDGMVLAGPGVVTGAVTTALAFSTISIGEFTAFAEMGVISCVGLLLTLLATFVLVPTLYGRLPRSPAGADSRVAPAPTARPSRTVDLLARGLRGMPKLILLVAVLAGLAGVVGLTRIAFNGRYFDFLPQETESSRGLLALEHDGAMSPLFAFVRADDIEDARDKARRLRAMDTVGAVQSPSDVLPALAEEGRLDQLRAGMAALGRAPDFAVLRARNPTREELQGAVAQLVDSLDGLVYELENSGRSTVQAQAASAAFSRVEARLASWPSGPASRLDGLEGQCAGLLERAWTTARAVADRGSYASADLPPLLRHRHEARDGGSAVALYVYPSGEIWADDLARRFTADVESVDERAAGHAISMHRHNEMIVSDFSNAVMISSALVFLIVLIDFRRLGDALLAFGPVVVGWAWMVGLLAVLEIRFNAANIVALPLLLGIGVDAGVHIMHRCRQSAQERGGVASLDDLVRGTGGAVFLSSATTIIGFAALTLADYGGMVSLGGVMVLGIACSIIASLVVLPALLVALGRAR